MLRPSRLRSAAAVLAAFALVLAPAADPGALPRPEPAEYTVEGLGDAVEIRVDHWGVPHIYARNDDDLYFAQGLNAARDRLFQIDLFRRRGLGLMAEAFGPEYAEGDRAARLFLYRGPMEEEWAAYGPRAERVAERFTDGVNAYIDWLEDNPAYLPHEFQELGYRPARWDPEDVVRIRTNALTGNLFSEVRRARVACAADTATDQARIRLQPSHTPRVPDGSDPCALPSGVLRDYALAVQGLTIAPPPPAAGTPWASEGSNAWAVAPGRTETGRPLLATDPHRALTSPSLRYLAHLSAPGTDVIGAGEPSMPGLALGHNGTMAFGLTYMSADQEDLYTYRLHPDDPALYRYAGGWERMAAVRERIPVRGSEPVDTELLFTRHGPVVLRDEDQGTAYAVRTTWSEPGTAAYFGALRLMHARDLPSFRAAAGAWGGPPLTFVYADTSGTVARVSGGAVPLRPDHDGLLPVPGDGRYEWSGLAEGALLPWEADPPEGFTAAANEYTPAPRLPAPVGYEWPSPYRHRRITGVLAADGSFGTGDAMALQNDRYSLPADELVPLLPGPDAGTGDTRAALELLHAWDRTAAEDSAGAALFETWLTRHLAPAVHASRVPGRAHPLIGPTTTETLVHEVRALDPGERERLFAATLADAYGEVSYRLGGDPSRWRWGDLQWTLFEHPAGEHIGPLPRGGAWDTVDVSSYRPGDFGQAAGASFRAVIDVGAWDRSFAASAPGQSADPASEHYDDLLPLWRRGDYFPLVYSREAVEENTAATIRLVPAPGGQAVGPARASGPR
ncbi:penicillin acylase family protein [Nocardiopsis suaedae]|uniref:Penicillin acylase family protein n=1 Tax=Nocardiopsis suaedae TaxID=3018444 RepID=A0ABT4TGK9_9ACTN|nr:penicillin acylase family protein [Nocardiopsis suaedae]MDA2803404.1 penicillin acylase family protein [Nocardiopsis suaedae]